MGLKKGIPPPESEDDIRKYHVSPAPSGVKYIFSAVAVLFLAMIAANFLGGNPWRELVRYVDGVARSQEEILVTAPRLKGRAVRVLRDPVTGVIQIEAENEADLLFGQGYAHAKDRLFQLDILRRLALGEMAELVGSKALYLDKWHRTMGYKQLAESDWQLIQSNPVHQGFKEALQAYSEGVNTYLKKRSMFFNMPVDVLVLGKRPRPFTPVDTLSFMRWHSSAMNKGWQNELVYAKLFSFLEEEHIEAIRSAMSYDSHDLAGGMTATLRKLHEVNKNSAAEIKTNGWRTEPVPVDPLIPGLAENGGSNAWVISGKHTATGRPILSNDPHLPFTLPAAWHSMRLKADAIGIDQMGLSCPLTPYIVSGHNRHIANGVTLGRCDVDDIFLENVTSEADGTRVYFDSDGTMKPVHSRMEYINVKGQEQPVALEVRETRRGPLVCQLLGVQDRECSLSSLSLQKTEVFHNELNQSSGGCLREFFLAKDYKDFREAAKHMALVNLNMVYADKEGNIGYQMTGRVPRRKDIGEGPREGWNPEHQWEGWVPFEEMPHTLNPEAGFVVSANQRPYYEGRHEERFLGEVWQHGWRARRIEELINEKATSGTKITAEDNAVWQRDLVAVPARRFAEMLRADVPADVEALSEDENVRVMVRLVREWDGEITVDSPAAAIYANVKEQMIRIVLNAVIPSQRVVDEVLGVGMISGGKMSNDLEGRQAAFFLRILEDDPAVRPLVAASNYTLPELCLESFRRGYTALSGATGQTDPSKWKWGELHQASFVHPLGKGGFPLREMFNVHIGAVPGDVDTVSLAAYLHQQEPLTGLPLPRALYEQRGFAASSRHVIDLGNDFDTFIIVAPGNSGRPSSKHYDDKKDVLTAPHGQGIDHLTRDTLQEDLLLETDLVKRL